MPWVPMASKWIFLLCVGVACIAILVVAGLGLTYVWLIFDSDFLLEPQKQMLLDILTTVKVFILGAVFSPIAKTFLRG